MRTTFENGHGEYIEQPTPGFCVRATDNQFDESNNFELYETTDSLYQCAMACNGIETCVAFDYQISTGTCSGFS